MSKTTPEEAISIAMKYGIEPKGVYPKAFLLYPTQLAALIDEVRGAGCECTRSHPHENMNAMCELRTVIARFENEKAQLRGANVEPVGLPLAEFVQKIEKLVRDECRREKDYPECSGNPASCPENEGCGCCDTFNKTPLQAAQTVQEIMWHIQQYVEVCMDGRHCAIRQIDDMRIAKIAAAFKPLEAALTALVDDNHLLKFELDGVRAMRGPEWQPIETAPKDGREFLAHSKEIGAVVVYWDEFDDKWGTGFAIDVTLTLTRWQPLPPSPTPGIEPEQGEVKS